MIIVNASPLIALTKIRRYDLFEQLFGKIVIPRAVYQETVEDDQAPVDQKQQILRAIETGMIEVVEIAQVHTFKRESLMNS